MRKNIFSPDHVMFQEAETEGTEGKGNGGTPPSTQPDLTAFIHSTTEGLKAIQTQMTAQGKTVSELVTLKEALSELRTDITALKTRAEEETNAASKSSARGRKTRTSPSTTEEGDREELPLTAPELEALQTQLKKMEADLVKANKRAEESDAKTAQAELRRRNTERDRLLHEMASKAGAIEPSDTVALYRDRMAYDEETDSWMFQVGDEQLTVEEGIKKVLPKYMQKPKTAGGGSGGHSPGNADGPSKAALKENAIKLGLAAQKHGTTGPHLSRYMQAKRAYEQAGGNAEDISQVVAQSV